MIINGANLAALRTGFSTLFKKGLGQTSSQYKKFATVVPATTKEQKYGWLGKIPSVREWIGARVVQNLSQSDYAINREQLTIGVGDDIETDRPLADVRCQSTGAKWDDELGFSCCATTGSSDHHRQHRWRQRPGRSDRQQPC
ncbi:Mu-like prophage major head subunit gpT family protein [Sphingomonas paucimobilis]|uniref:Mu-like prophage major head subunit gpT family protein n=1 Tax=Sphingomonas paucimobilis TaxID=13689 RepID=UPI0019665842|nr:Mu-like prophage major head subunit gpT family protein [Sphingomonas paucimobilis]QRY97256.1 Mu-like prophage major head subunit gpT family protein [Sphingomonas paucimobilis]